MTALWILSRHEYRGRYRAQALGVIWSIFQPIVMMGLLSLVMARLFKTSEHYPIFVLIGILTWNFFTAAVNAGTISLVTYADLVKRTVFPRAVIPASSVMSYFINFCIESISLLVFIPIFPSSFRASPALLLVPVLVASLVMFTIGLVLITSTLNVVFRDLAYAVQTGLTLLYWLTPFIYPLSTVPQPYQTILGLSPLARIVEGLRGVVIHGTSPGPLDLLVTCATAAATLGLGILVFRRAEGLMLDHV